MSRCQHISQCTLQASALHSQTGLPSHKQSLHPQDLHAAAQDLRNSARLGKLDRIAYLLAKHEKRLAALLVAPSPSTGKTALHLAAEEGHLGTVRALLEAARTAGPLPPQELPPAAAPAEELQGNIFQRGLRSLRSRDLLPGAADSQAGGGAVSPRAKRGSGRLHGEQAGRRQRPGLCK